MAAPAVVIRLELEASPVVYIDAVGEHETCRLEDWINSQQAILRLIRTAQALGEKHPA